MIFRFSEVKLLENNEYDFDNAKFLGAIEHKDYVEYTKLLHYMQSEDINMRREWGNVELVDERRSESSKMYSIVDITLRIPLDKVNLECMEVYVLASY
jgi:hypothetical protein